MTQLPRQQPNLGSEGDPLADYMQTYSQRLDNILNPQIRVPNPMGRLDAGDGPYIDPGDTIEQTPPEQQQLAGPAGPVLQAQQQPAQQQPQQPAAATFQKNEKGQIKMQSRPPDFQFDADPKKLEKAKTFGEVLDAVPAKKQNEYMDWWEQQYGSINSKYDQMRTELGERPDPEDRSLSRKDKFTLLMEFGLNMLKASQRPGSDTGTNLGAAVHDTVRGDQARRKERYERHRGLETEIEKRRSDELKQIGTRGDAMRDQASMDANRSQQALAEAQLETYNEQPQQIIYEDDGGVVGVNRRGQGRTITDEEGRPLKSTLGVGRGSRTRAGGTGGFAPSNIEKVANFYAKTYNIPIEAATDIARAEQTEEDPFKMYERITTGQLRQYATPEEADKIARQLVEGAFGTGALDQAPRTPLREDAPRRPRANLGAPQSRESPLNPALPAKAMNELQKLAPGQALRIKRNGVEELWALDENGQPKRVLR